MSTPGRRSGPDEGRSPGPAGQAGPQEGLDDEADRWLIGKVRAGDRDAYEELVRRHRDRIYRIALRMLGSSADADDVAQEVVIQLWTALSASPAAPPSPPGSTASSSTGA